MKVLLGSYDNWDIVESGYEKPDDVAVLSDAEKMALKDSNKKDQRAFIWKRRCKVRCPLVTVLAVAVLHMA